LFCHCVDDFRIFHRHDDGIAEIMVAFYMGGDTDEFIPLFMAFMFLCLLGYLVV
jgi:hypothetical protein